MKKKNISGKLECKTSIYYHVKRLSKLENLKKKIFLENWNVSDEPTITRILSSTCSFKIEHPNVITIQIFACFELELPL